MKEAELADAHVLGQHMEGHGSKPQPGSPDFEKGLLTKPAFVEITLESFIPCPAPDDVRPHRSSFDLESEIDVLLTNTEPGKDKVKGKVGQFHMPP